MLLFPGSNSIQTDNDKAGTKAETLLREKSQRLAGNRVQLEGLGYLTGTLV